MPGPVIMLNTVQLTFKGLRSGVPYENVLHVRFPATPTHADVIDVAQRSYLNMMPIWVAAQGNALTWQATVAKDLTVPNGYAYTQPATAHNLGTRGGDQEAGNNAKCIQWQASIGGRKGHGFSYFGPLVEQDCAGDYVQSNIIAALVAVAENALAQVFGASGALAIGSPTDHDSKLVTGYLITSLINDIGRRLINRGRRD